MADTFFFGASISVSLALAACAVGGVRPQPHPIATASWAILDRPGPLGSSFATNSMTMAWTTAEPAPVTPNAACQAEAGSLLPPRQGSCVNDSRDDWGEDLTRPGTTTAEGALPPLDPWTMAHP